MKGEISQKLPVLLNHDDRWERHKALKPTSTYFSALTCSMLLFELDFKLPLCEAAVSEEVCLDWCEGCADGTSAGPAAGLEPPHPITSPQAGSQICVQRSWQPNVSVSKQQRGFTNTPLAPRTDYRVVLTASQNATCGVSNHFKTAR